MRLNENVKFVYFSFSYGLKNYPNTGAEQFYIAPVKVPVLRTDGIYTN